MRRRALPPWFWLALLVTGCAATRPPVAAEPPSEPPLESIAPSPPPEELPPLEQAIEAYQEEYPEDDYDYAIEGGVVGGVPGGVVSGAPGGVVGGILGPMPGDLSDGWGAVDEAKDHEVAGEEIERHRIRGQPILPPLPIRDRITRSKRGFATATVGVCLSATGAITSTRIVTQSGYPEYDHALLEGLWSWEFSPVRVGDEAIAVCGKIDFRYPEAS